MRDDLGGIILEGGNAAMNEMPRSPAGALLLLDLVAAAVDTPPNTDDSPGARGRRRSDVHRMTWADVSAGAIRVVQQKTGVRLAIPLHPALAEISPRCRASTSRF